MINRYEIGDLVRATGPFRDSLDGTPVDPDVVLFSYQNPAGTTTTLTFGVDAAVVKDSLGNYHCDFSVTSSGRWWYRWHSTGSGQAAFEREIYVKPSPFSA